MQTLAGKTAVITGASSGLGYAAALAFAKAGAGVVAVARRANRLEQLVEAIRAAGGHAVHVVGDAAAEQTAVEAVTTAVKEFGSLDILINNAGMGRYKALAETSVSDFDDLVRTNLRSSFVFTRAVVPHLVEARSGQIVFVSSVAGLAGAANESVYSATKFAQVGFAQSLDAELRSSGIKVTAFCPGGMKTEFAIGHGRDADRIATSCMMDPAEVADALLWACSMPANLRIPHTVIRHMG